MTETTRGSSPYTAGPWIQTWQIDPDSEPVIAVTTQKNEVIAIVYPDWQPDEVEANASLIAAAPELMDACRFALDRLHDFPALDDEWLSERLHCIIAVLDKAIAKAESK